MAMVNYEGKLGRFEYDDEIFSISHMFSIECLRYIGNETDGSKIIIPKGIVDCGYMFYVCKYLKTAPSIPDGVKYCSLMFSGCVSIKEAPSIPEGVKYCGFMFYECTSLK